MRMLLVATMMMVPVSTSFAAENRYSLAETKDGTIRLDRQSGTISYCRKIGSGIACSMAADERSALMTQNEELEARIEALENRIAALESDAGISAPSQAIPRPDGDDATSPKLDEKEERQIDKAMRVTENVMRRFIDVIKDLRKEYEIN